MRTPDDIVRMEVYYCVSALVSTLAQGYGDSGLPADLGQVCEQAFELACPIDDWQEAAEQAGWSAGVDTTDSDFTHPDSTQVYNNWQTLCECEGIEPYQWEVFEHWIVSDWLADKLEARGEKVDRDFAGLTVWTRTTTGQAIAMDSVIEAIAADLGKGV